MSGLQLIKSDTVRVSALPVAGCMFPAVFLGKVALDVVGLGASPTADMAFISGRAPSCLSAGTDAW